MYYVMKIYWDGREEQIAICTTEDMAHHVAQAMREQDRQYNTTRRFVVV